MDTECAPKSRMIEVADRRAKVAFLLAQSMTRQEIAERLGIRVDDVTNDIVAMRQLNIDWLKDLSREGFIFENRMAIEKLKYAEQELAELRPRCASDVKARVTLERVIMDNVKLQLEIMAKGPMMYALNEVLKRKVASTAQESIEVLEEIKEDAAA